MHFGFALELSNVDLLNVDLLDTHLDLLDTDIPSKYFACLHNAFKTSSRHVFKASSRHVFRTSSRHVFKTSSRHVFKTSSRRLQRSNFLSSKTSSRRCQDVFKTSCKISSRRLQDVLEDVKLLGWRRVQDVFKTSSRPTNVCWVDIGRFSWWICYKTEIRPKVLPLKTSNFSKFYLNPLKLCTCRET